MPALRPLLETGKLNLSLLELGLGCAHREQLSIEETLDLMHSISGQTCTQAKREKKESTTESVEAPTATRARAPRCAYVDPITQKPCHSTRGLEIDHRQSWYRGGKTELSNLRLLCRGHHARISFLEFGESAKFWRRP
jgi:hypothetical protein